MPNDPKAEQRECSPDTKDPSILRPASLVVSHVPFGLPSLSVSVCFPDLNLLADIGYDSRSPLHPTDRLPTHAQCIGSIQQPPFRTLQHPSLLYQILQHRSSLSYVIIYTIFTFLQE